MIRGFIMKRVVSFAGQAMRTPVLRRPDDYDMDYEEVFFQAPDGVTLEGWYIPAKTKSDKVVICNHFSPGNRYGYAGHLRGYRNFGGFEVNFIPKYKALSEGGYNVFTYDLRNHGLSGSSHNGGYNVGLFGYRDVIGSLNYIRKREDTKDMDIHLHSVCLGGNATLVAMRRNPQAFEDVKSMMLIQPLSSDVTAQSISNMLRMGKRGPELYEKYYRQVWGFRGDDVSPRNDAASVSMPTFVTQVREDTMTTPEDVQAIYDAIPVEDKKIYWIEGTKQRFRGYTYYSENSSQMIDWYNQY